MATQKQKNAALNAFRDARPDLEADFAREQTRVAALNEVIKSGPFDLGAGDTDLYQAFAWRNWQLLRVGGRSAVVLPRGALSGSPLTEWRQAVLADGTFADVCFLVNNQRWVFPEVHPQYTIALTVTERGGDGVVGWAGPFASEKEFGSGAETLAKIPNEEFVTWSDNFAFPLIPDPKSAQIFGQMKISPRFDEVREGWAFRLTNELHSTNDRSLYDFDLSKSAGRTPVLAGASIHLWNPDAAEPYAYAVTKILRKHLAEKLTVQLRQSRSSYFGMQFSKGVLPMDRPRIVFRKIARATDSRTSIACLIPPGNSITEAGQIVVTVHGGAKQEAFLLGVLSSIPFDWAARRWVEMNFNFYVMNPLPVPLYTESSVHCARVMEIAGSLAASDDRYAIWAAEVGVPMGSVNSQVHKDELIAELDALVSLLYGLSEDQVEHVFATFHRGWKYEPRLEAVMQHYGTWEGKA